MTNLGERKVKFHIFQTSLQSENPNGKASNEKHFLAPWLCNGACEHRANVLGVVHDPDRIS